MSWPSWLSRPKFVPLMLGLVAGIIGGLALGLVLRVTTFGGGWTAAEAQVLSPAWN